MAPFSRTATPHRHTTQKTANPSNTSAEELEVDNESDMSDTQQDGNATNTSVDEAPASESETPVNPNSTFDTLLDSLGN